MFTGMEVAATPTAPLAGCPVAVPCFLWPLFNGRGPWPLGNQDMPAMSQPTKPTKHQAADPDQPRETRGRDLFRACSQELVLGKPEELAEAIEALKGGRTVDGSLSFAACFRMNGGIPLKEIAKLDKDGGWFHRIGLYSSLIPS